MTATVLQRCQTVNAARSVRVRQERRLSVSEGSAEGNTGGGDNYSVRGLMICTQHQNIIQVMK